jgi:pantoate--beta-alanine ligase
MRTVRTIPELREALAPHRRAGRCIGLVPTMGAFHEGHLSLMRRARGESAVVVVSLFVNPTQFRPGEDLSAYPRDEAADSAAAEALGVDVLFAPAPDEVYPPGFSTEVRVGGVTDPLEGANRGPEHFHGVTTVVTKLFNMVGPDVAYFGQKDAQQAVVIRKLVRDLDLPVRIEVCPTVREADGLAMSSRNVYLQGADRERAAALSKALRAAEQAVSAGERDAASVAATARAELEAQGVEPEYLELVSTDTLVPVDRIGDSDVLVAVAAKVGPARLIDNMIIHANGRQ